MKELALILAALADENRLRLLHLLRSGEICVCYLQAALQTNQPKISRHLAYLKKAGLVEGRRERKWIYYSLKKQKAPVQKLLDEVLGLAGTERVVRQDLLRAKKQPCSPKRSAPGK